MCGIAGFVQRAPAPGLLTAMLGDLAHRGPDGQGIHEIETEAGFRVSLGHRRLSIIDLEGGKQPLSNQDGKLWITFNGEIYNFLDLRERLLGQGHVFATRSDTEVIVHQYEETGARAFGELNGMFAFALWDGRKQELVLVRDRFGVKPLYYAELADGGLVFASELAAVLRHPGVDRTLAEEGLSSYLFSDYAHPPLTLVRGVKKLAPGHALVWKDGRLSRPKAFWELTEGAPVRAGRGGSEPLAHELWERLEIAVKRQLIADVPVGVFLSGGLDSSSVAAIARKLTPYRLKTFSIGFEQKSFDESGYARQVAKHIDSEHIEQILSDRDVLDVVLPALDHLDEPLADPSFIPTYLVSRLAAQHVKVALGGDAGDELFGGYPTYLAHRYGAGYGRLPKSVRGGLVPALLQQLPVSHEYQSLEWKLKRFALRWDEDAARRHLRWMSSTDLPDVARLFPPLREGREPATLRAERPIFHDPLNAVLATDFVTYLPGSVLAKVDRAAMAHGLETRPPMLDNDLVDWSFRLPSDLKVKQGKTKWLFKRAALPHLPADIVMRPKKGFAIPASAWLRGPLRPVLDEVLEDGPLWQSGLDRDAFRAFRDEHMAMRVDRGKALWALLVLGRWARRFLAPGSATLRPHRTKQIRETPRRSPLMAQNSSSESADRNHLGSPERFGYEWSTYHEILPESREQLVRWMGSTGLDSVKGKDVMDVGCGMGRNPYWMAKAGAKSVLGVDLDDGSLAAARKNLEPLDNARVEKCSAYDLDPEKLGTFDRVTCIGVLHHLAEPELALRKMWACVRPGGELVLWCYGKEGNNLLVPVIQSVRAVCSRLPLPAAHGVAKVITVGLWPALHVLPIKTDYYKKLKTLSFGNVQSIVFDQIIPRIANYWTREDMHRLVRPLGGDVFVEFVQGNSWHARITKKPATDA